MSPPSSPAFIIPYGLEYLCGQLGQLSLLCPLPSPWALSASLLVIWGTEMSLALCKPCSATAVQHPWTINTAFSTSPKHSLIPATVKKIHSSPAKTPSYSKGCGSRPPGVQERFAWDKCLLYCSLEFPLRQFCLFCPNTVSAADPDSLSKA